MIEEITIKQYRCPTCRHIYKNRSDADRCFGRTVTHDRGVKVGDTVRITSGDGAGGTATVTKVCILDKDWGHYAWERYWHTVALEASVDNGWGSRFLAFDSYEVLP